MLIPELEMNRIFEKILKRNQGNSISVGILSSQEIDSLCGSQILMVTK